MVLMTCRGSIPKKGVETSEILLMEEIRCSPPGMYKTPVNGMNYQPQVVSRISEPSTVAEKKGASWPFSLKNVATVK